MTTSIAHLQRPEVVGRRERGVDDGHDPVFLRDLHDAGEVDHAQVGIRGRFGEDDVGVGPEGLLDGLGGRVHHGDRDAELRKRVLREVARLAVAVAGEDDVPVRLHVGQQRQDDGAHAGREEDRPLGPFDRRELALAFLLGRVAVAPVFVLPDRPALFLGLHELEDGRGVLEVIVRGLDDRRGDREVRFRDAAAAVYAEGGGLPVFRALRFIRHSGFSWISGRSSGRCSGRP